MERVAGSLRCLAEGTRWSDAEHQRHLALRRHTGPGERPAAKAAVDALTRTLAVEWGPERIRVNAIAPGPVADTEGVRRLLPGEAAEKLRAIIPTRRLGSIDDIVNLALFVMSDAGANLNGAILVCDGGLSLSGRFAHHYTLDQRQTVFVGSAESLIVALFLRFLYSRKSRRELGKCSTKQRNDDYSSMGGYRMGKRLSLDDKLATVRAISSESLLLATCRIAGLHWRSLKRGCRGRRRDCGERAHRAGRYTGIGVRALSCRATQERQELVPRRLPSSRPSTSLSTCGVMFSKKRPHTCSLSRCRPAQRDAARSWRRQFGLSRIGGRIIILCSRTVWQIPKG